MTRALVTMREAVRARPLLFLAIAVAFPLAFHALLLLALVLRFGSLPNYATGYDWFGNVAHIIASTDSIRDITSIALDEWLLEVGYMNRDFGLGISEWSLTLIPHKMLFVVLAGLLVALNVVLIRRLSDRSAAGSGPGAAVTGLGAACAVTTSVTLFWVVCCASPTWSVGLAMLGIIGPTAALTLDPVGAWITVLGFVILIPTAFRLATAGERAARPRAVVPEGRA